MAPTPDFSAISDLFTNTWTLGTEWLIPLAITIVGMAVLTKDTEKWKILAFPMFIMLRIIGMPVHFLLLGASGLIFVVEALSTQIVGNLFGTVKKWTGEGTNEELRMKKDNKVIDRFLKAEQYERRYDRFGLDEVQKMKGRGIQVGKFTLGGTDFKKELARRQRQDVIEEDSKRKWEELQRKLKGKFK